MKKITYIFFALLLFALNTSQAQVQRVRIEFTSPTGYVRPLLLGFDPTDTATDGVDFGWDVLNFDSIPGDLNWLIEDDRYVVQGVGAFDETKVYPFGLYLTYDGAITISLKALENFNTPIDVFIYDAYLDTYYKINDTDYTTLMLNSDYLDMLFIAFLEPESLSASDNNLQEPEIKYLNKTKELYINTYNKSTIKQVILYNILGQTIKSFNANNLRNTPSNKIPIKNIADGTYFVRVETSKTISNKKIIIQ